MTQPGQQGAHDLYGLGLQADLAMWARSPRERRRILRLGAAGIGLLLAGAGGPALGTARAAARAAACVTTIPQETAGPYPADGSQASSTTLNALALSGIVRQDIRSSLSTGTTAPGVPLTIELTLIDSTGTGESCAPQAGAAVYLWHCDRDGAYSLYSDGITGEDYLRGVRAADANGKVTFTSIFPACYSGRWPHIHFEVYPALSAATAASSAIHTSQLALPEADCNTVYATSGYSQSVTNLARITLASDNVFGDGADLQIATVAGDVAGGYTAALTVGIDPAGTNQGGGTGPGSDGSPAGAPPAGALPSGPPPSGAPSSGTSPAAPPVRLPNTGTGAGAGAPGAWVAAAPIAALGALLVPLARRRRRR